MMVMRGLAVAVSLATVVAVSAMAQGGPRGSGQAFGMGSWVLHENGVDSIAAIIDLTQEQRTQLDELAFKFRSENAEAIGRMNQMRAEIDSLWTDLQRPRREAMSQIAEKYDFPERDLRPALTKLHQDVAGIITVEQQAQLQRGRVSPGRVGRGVAGQGYGGGQRRFASGRVGSRSQFGMRGRGSGMRAGRMGQMRRLRLHRPPPIEP
jgi:Spy/CpxP family protein refolding chaperone